MVSAIDSIVAKLTDLVSRRSSLVTVLLVWTVAQVIAVLAGWDRPQGFDAPYYMEQAAAHAAAGTLYPTAANLFDTYIQAPSYINLLAVVYRLTGGYQLMLLLNILMALVTVYCLWWLCRRFLGCQVAAWAVLLWCLLPSNVLASASLLTEVPYLMFGLLACRLAFAGSRQLAACLAAGIVLGLAQTIRPIAVAFLAAILLMLWLERRRWHHFVAILLTYGVVLTASGLYSQATTGHFVASSTVGGYDLMYTAYDGADGGQHPWAVFAEGGAGYIADEATVDFAAKDSIWRSRSIEWISRHPVRYLSLCFKRLPMLLKSDTWVIGALRVETVPLWAKLAVNVPWLLLLAAFVVSLCWLRASASRLLWVLMLYAFLGVGATCLFGVETRYHHPYVFVMIVWTAAAICRRWAVSPATDAVSH